MNTSGDAAEQIVRLSLEGVEVAAKITGSAAKEMAVLLYTILKNKDKNKIKGRQRLTSMLKSGKELTIFSVKSQDLKKFSEDAKRYGVVYCVIRNPKDGAEGKCDIMVRAEDAAKINRIVDNIKVATVDTEAIRSDIEQSKSDKYGYKTVPEKDMPDKNQDDMLLDELMVKPTQKEASAPENPTAARTEKSPPSEPISESRAESAKGTSKSERPSVREELKEIRQKQKQAADSPMRDQAVPDKPKQQKTTQHQQPQGGKKKSKKSKER